MLLVKNGLVYDAVSREPQKVDILIENGKIKEMGVGLSADCDVFDAAGCNIYPGFVEAHCHTGLEGSGIGFEGMDINEVTDPVTPHMRAIDGLNPFDPTLREALAAGVVTVCTGPGSANPVGGQAVVMKLYGHRADDMVIDPYAAMKCAFGENPKRVYRDKKSNTRMAVAALLRETLAKAQEYDRKKREAENDPSKAPAYDIKMEAMLPVVRGEKPIKCHAHQANDIFTAIRIAKEFGVKITLEHVTEGHLIADELAAEDLPLAVGPSLTHATKFELQHKTFTTPGILANKGCRVAIITDAPVIPLNYLPLAASLAMKSGMDEFDALRGITIRAAEHIGVADRVGSLEVGKDADLVIMDGPWHEVATTVRTVIVDGVVAFSAQE